MASWSCDACGVANFVDRGCCRYCFTVKTYAQALAHGDSIQGREGQEPADPAVAEPAEPR
eukprot:8721842-Heterocapsa_arctica.AAC.1